MRKISLALALLLCVSVLAGCGGDSLANFKHKNGKYTVGKDVYVPSGLLYEPTSVGEAYAFYKRGNVTLYRIGDNDPSLWLTEEYVSGMTTVFHSESITLPDLPQLGAEKVIVCQSDAVTVALCEITDEAVLAALIDLYVNGAEADMPVTDADAEYELKFYSSAWPQIYINLGCLVYGEDMYLYDATARRGVALGDLLAPYFQEVRS